MRIIFMGTPDFAMPTLDALLAAGHDIVAVYSQPPRPSHRGKRVTPGAVHARAEANGLMVRTPVSLRDPAEQAAFAALDADVAVVAAYGLILPPPVLASPRQGCLNVHGSLLPRWRGAAPVQRAILAGDAATGVMVMQMEAGLDTGPVRAAAQMAVANKSAGALTAELATLGARLMAEVLADLDAFPPVPQPETGVTYAAKIDKAETRIAFTQPAAMIERQLRAFDPLPGAWFEHASERIRAFRGEALPAADGPSAAPGTVLDDRLTIACGQGALRLTEVQRAGRPRMGAADFLRGTPVSPGTSLA